MLVSFDGFITKSKDCHNHEPTNYTVGEYGYYEKTQKQDYIKYTNFDNEECLPEEFYLNAY